MLGKGPFDGRQIVPGHHDDEIGKRLRDTARIDSRREQLARRRGTGGRVRAVEHVLVQTVEVPLELQELGAAGVGAGRGGSRPSSPRTRSWQTAPARRKGLASTNRAASRCW